MRLKRLFVVFEEFSGFHRNKDVGAIPAGMRAFGFLPAIIADTYESAEFHMIRPVKRKWLPGLIGRVGSILALRGHCEAGDVVNLYHLSSKTLIQSLAIRLLLPGRVVVWLKLDMNTTERSLRIAMLVGGELRARNLEEFAMKMVARMICATVDVISVESITCYRHVRHWPVRKIVHLPNGIFRREFRDISHLRRNVICSVARHGDSNKRSEHLLSAFCQLNLPDWELDLVGPVTDDFKAEYERMVHGAGNMSRRVTLAGNIADRYALLARLARSKIFVLLSMYEGFSLALLEAAASGCFCVATDVGGASDVVSGGGILLPRDFTPDQLLDALRRATGQHGFDHPRGAESTVARFDWDSLLRDFVPNLG